MTTIRPNELSTTHFGVKFYTGQCQVTFRGWHILVRKQVILRILRKNQSYSCAFEDYNLLCKLCDLLTTSRHLNC